MNKDNSILDYMGNGNWTQIIDLYFSGSIVDWRKSKSIMVGYWTCYCFYGRKQAYEFFLMGKLFLVSFGVRVFTVQRLFLGNYVDIVMVGNFGMICWTSIMRGRSVYYPGNLVGFDIL